MEIFPDIIIQKSLSVRSANFSDGSFRNFFRIDEKVLVMAHFLFCTM